MDYSTKKASAAATDMGLAGDVLGTFAGPITGLLGLGGNVLSWILGSDKFDWNKWKKDQYADINRNYDTSLSKATEQANKTAQSTIGEATNKQVMAGGVAGINNPGRLEAQTYANIAQNRDNAITSITNGLEQNRSAMLSAVSREAAEGTMKEDFNAPTTLDYISNMMKTLSTTTGQEGVGALFGAPLAGIKSLLGGGKIVNPSTTVKQTTNTISPVEQSTGYVNNNLFNPANPKTGGTQFNINNLFKNKGTSWDWGGY